jgi:hypothetical protein
MYQHENEILLDSKKLDMSMHFLLADTIQKKKRKRKSLVSHV